MRRDSREMAFKIIFESFFNENPFDEELISQLKEKDLGFCVEIIDCYKKNKEEIAQSLKKYLIGYNIDRVYKIDLALIYMAIVEIKFLKTPAAVAVNEALELSKLYSTEKSPKFLNGVLSSYIKGENI